MSFKVENYIVMEECIYQGSKEEYMEAAEELADNKQMPVLIEIPYSDRNLMVFPRKTKT